MLYVPAVVPAEGVGVTVADLGELPQAASAHNAPTQIIAFRFLGGRQNSAKRPKPNGNRQSILCTKAVLGGVVVTVTVEPFTMQDPIGIEQAAVTVGVAENPVLVTV